MDYQLFKTLLEAFIERHYHPEEVMMMDARGKIEAEYDAYEDSEDRPFNRDLKNAFIKPTQDTFTVLLLKLIDQARLKDSEVYTIAGISRQHFSKMRSDPEYQPKKETVLKLTIALKLRWDAAQKLADSAGYSISEASLYDCVIKFCLLNKIYEPLIIDQFLEERNLRPLFSSM